MSKQAAGRATAALWRVTGPGVWAAALLVAASAVARDVLSEAVGAWWDLGRIGLVFGVMVVLLHRRRSVGTAIFVATGAMLVLFPIRVVAPRELRQVSLPLLREAALLTVVVYLINILGRLLAAREGLKRLIYALGHLVRDVRLVGAIIPSTIGMLPTPGGAMITAPLVQEMGNTIEMDAETRTVCNYWFRHVWEFWWPLFPAVIYLINPHGMNLPLPEFIRVQFPLSLVAIGVGWFFIIRPLPRGTRAETDAHPLESLAHVVSALWPVLFVALGVTLVPLWVPGLGAYKFEVFIAALVVSCGLLVALKRLPFDEVRGLVGQEITARMAGLVFGVYALRWAFDATRAAEHLPDLLTQSRIPVPIVCFFVPWVVGLLTGYTFAGVGSTFAFLQGLLRTGGAPSVPLVALAYTGSYMGVMLSPTHLCLVLTREYFGAHLGDTYRRLTPMYLIVCAAIAAVYLLAR